MRLHTKTAAAFGATAALLLSLTGTAQGAATVTPVAQGFIGPLGLGVTAYGTTAYVAESFAGLLTKVNTATGAKTVIASQPGGGIEGTAVTPDGRVLYTNLIEPAKEGDRPQALLFEVRPGHKPKAIADIAKYERKRNPDAKVTYGFDGLAPTCVSQLPDVEGLAPYTGIVDAHPYAMTAANGAYYVADAAGNAILKVTRHGRVSALALLPRQPLAVTADVRTALNQALAQETPPGETAPVLPTCVVGSTYYTEPVPTDVEVGPNGLLYVSTLPGGPEVPGLPPRGSVYSVNPFTGAVALVATGFNAATDLAVTPTGDIYVAELFGAGITKVGGGVVAALPMVSTVEWANGALWATYDIFPPDENSPPNGKLAKIVP